MAAPTHLDLFSGIGGFALAAQWAGFRTVGFCELDKYCQKVLAKNFPDVPIIADVFDLLCDLKNSEPLHCETSPFVMRSDSTAESQDSASIAVQPDFFPEVSQSEGGDSVHGNAGKSPCAAPTVQTQAADNGCAGNPIPIGNMGTDIQFVTSSNSLNGGGACSHGIVTSASDASSPRKAKGNSTRTTSNRGHNFQSTDLKLITDLLYASHATRGYTVDLLTAGFPCQPFSVAGKQRGKDDDRHLWPSLCEIIGLLRPTFCLLENVPGLIPMELDNVLSDLEGIGYATRAFVIPACAVDARHRRDRLWIVAHAISDINKRTQRGSDGISGAMAELDRQEHRSSGQSCGTDSEIGRSTVQGHEVPDTGGSGLEGCAVTGNSGGSGAQREEQSTGLCGTQDMADTEGTELAWERGDSRGWRAEPGRCCRWLAEPSVCGMAPRLPEGLHGYWQYPDEWEGVPRVSKGVKDRVSRLKALGNSIQPQVAYELLREIRKLL